MAEERTEDAPAPTVVPLDVQRWQRLILELKEMARRSTFTREGHHFGEQKIVMAYEGGVVPELQHVDAADAHALGEALELIHRISLDRTLFAITSMMRAKLAGEIERTGRTAARDVPPR